MAKKSKFNQDTVQNVLDTTVKVATGVATIVGTIATLTSTMKKK